MNEVKNKDNMKNVIRLNEDSLHRLIEGCVREALNELDPRTYASYADKRASQGQEGKAEEGRSHAKDAWNREYGLNADAEWTPELERLKMDTSTFNNYNVDHKYPKSMGGGTEHYYPYRNKFSGERKNELYSNPKAYNVAKQMSQGNGKYVKGQGWQ